MNDLEYLINQIKLEHKSAGRYPFKAQFYPYKNISHTIRRRNGTIFIRISDKLQNAPDPVLKSIALILMDKLFREKTGSNIRKTYRDYISKHIVPQIPAAPRKISDKYRTNGTYFNLDTIFDKVNQHYFDFSIKKPVIGWSLNKSIRRLGFYDHERSLLVISKLFDHSRVPNYVVEYIMYHEMLHIVHPVIKRNGRRKVHSKEFKSQEFLFKEYTLATEWINKKLWRLKFSF